MTSLSDEDGEKWDHSIENLLRKTSLGFMIGVVPSLIVARKPITRFVTVMFCTGFGAGMGYSEARYLFESNVCFDRRHVVSLDWITSTLSSSSPAPAK
jgi:hypothetical protein